MPFRSLYLDLHLRFSLLTEVLWDNSLNDVEVINTILSDEELLLDLLNIVKSNSGPFLYAAIRFHHRKLRFPIELSTFNLDLHILISTLQHEKTLLHRRIDWN